MYWLGPVVYRRRTQWLRLRWLLFLVILVPLTAGVTVIIVHYRRVRRIQYLEDPPPDPSIKEGDSDEEIARLDDDGSDERRSSIRTNEGTAQQTSGDDSTNEINAMETEGSNFNSTKSQRSISAEPVVVSDEDRAGNSK